MLQTTCEKRGVAAWPARMLCSVGGQDSQVEFRLRDSSHPNVVDCDRMLTLHFFFSVAALSAAVRSPIIYAIPENSVQIAHHYNSYVHTAQDIFGRLCCGARPSGRQ